MWLALSPRSTSHVVSSRRLLTDTEWEELFSFENPINPAAEWD